MCTACTPGRFTRYVTSYYWAVTSITTVGYGDIVAYTDLEKVIAILVEMSGGVAFGLLCGTLTQLIHATTKTEEVSLFTWCFCAFSVLLVAFYDNKLVADVS